MIDSVSGYSPFDCTVTVGGVEVEGFVDTVIVSIPRESDGYTHQHKTEDGLTVCFETNVKYHFPVDAVVVVGYIKEDGEVVNITKDNFMSLGKESLA